MSTKKPETPDARIGELEETLKARDEVIAGLTSALHDAELKVAVIRAGGSERLLLPLLKATTELRQENGTRTVVVMSNGQPKLRADARTVEDYLPLQDHIAEMRIDPEYLGAFGSQGVSGGGTRPVRTAKRRQRTVSRDDLKAIGRHASEIARGDMKVR